ncbi:hypothetical protein HNQ36_003672 [Afipia massiliensis]|uniref:Uncharacterized protein n=1 Tax=Afipia massiliensis TaxID=211460 RepID=A0A840N439_9BRAD|nr:hypothetical protein [Afipia massiliensis]
MAAQVLEHFPSKWKPGFQWQNAAKHSRFSPQPAAAPLVAISEPEQ